MRTRIYLCTRCGTNAAEHGTFVACGHRFHHVLRINKCGPVTFHETSTCGPMRDPTLDEAWEGVMLTYTEQDHPASKPYERQIPGWRCRTCDRQYGSSGLPPKRCDCGQEWAQQ